jgi:hypothetical protein
MAYIGHQAADRFVSQPAVDQFSGDGSTTAFTLSFPVSSDQDILVSVDGVIQDTAAYAVSSGTTLTFTTAPSSNSGNNIFVNYLARTSATVAHPSTSALAATTGAFSDAVTMAGAATVDGTLTANALTTLVGSVTHGTDSGDTRFSVNSANQYTMVFKNAGNIAGQIGGSGSDVLRFSNAAGTTTMEMNAGQQTLPLQPAFNVHPASEQADVAINQNVTVVFGTERFDVGSNFSSNTFTAPVTGKYLLTTNLYLGDFDASADYFQTEIHTSNYTYKVVNESSSNDHDTFSFASLSVVADMDANDTAIVRVFQGSGAAQVDIETGSSFTGALIC